jgi:uncharacterized membrane protein YozB (DUF420 family)
VNAFIARPLNFFRLITVNSYQIVATASLVIQLVILGLLVAGVWLRAKKKFRQHGITMLTAVVFHVVIIFAWMVPSFDIFIFADPINLADEITLLILVHAFTGIAATALGIWLVAAWRLKADMKTCFAKKRVMLATITLWLIAIVIGFILYIIILQLL